MEYRFDVVAVRIQHERAVVAGMIRAQPGRTIVTTTVGQGRRVERIDHGAVACLECQVMAASEFTLRRLAVNAGHEQFVGPEESVARAAHGHVQHAQHGGIEALAGRQVSDHQLDMVEQSSAMQFPGFHAGSQARQVGKL